MIGIDITSVKRFVDKSTPFAKKVLSAAEFVQWQISSNQALFLAQRWAIKEAIFKANNQYYDFGSINIVRQASGQFAFANFAISTSKEDDYVVAFVMEVN